MESSSLDLLEQLDLLIGQERHDGLLPVAAPSGVAALALELAAHLHGAHVADLDREDGLDRVLDLDAVGVARHLEGVLVLALAHHRTLLRDERPPHDRPGFPHRAKISFICARPLAVTSSASAWSSSYGLICCASVVCTLARLRHERTTFGSASSITSSVR